MKEIDLGELSFYWRAADSSEPYAGVPTFLPYVLKYNEDIDLIEQQPQDIVKKALKDVYKLGYNIGYLQDSYGTGSLYLDSFLKFLIPNIKDKNSSILEIGCGGCQILSHLMKANYQNIKGIDPSPVALNKAIKYDIPIIQEFFCDNSIYGNFDIIFHHNVLEHVFDPISFIEGNIRNLSEGGLIIAGVPDCTESIMLGDLSMVWHEHISYFDIESLKNLFIFCGLSDVKVERSTYGGLLYVVGKNKNNTTDFSSRKYLKTNKFDNFVQKYKINLQKISKIVSEVSINNSTLGIYVPLRFINYLSVLNLPSSLFHKIRFYDDDPSTLNKYYDGFPIKIGNINSLISDPPNKLIICSYTFVDKIISRIPNHVISNIEVITLSDIVNEK